MRRASASGCGRQLAASLAGDPAMPQLLGWTRLGHLEIVRPRRFRSLSETMLEASGEAAQKRGNAGVRGAAPYRGRGPRQPGGELASDGRSGSRGCTARSGGGGACRARNPPRTPDRDCSPRERGGGRRTRSRYAAFCHNGLVNRDRKPISAAWPVPAIPIPSCQCRPLGAPAGAGVRSAASRPFHGIGHSVPAAAPISISAAGSRAPIMSKPRSRPKTAARQTNRSIAAPPQSALNPDPRSPDRRARPYPGNSRRDRLVCERYCTATKSQAKIKRLIFRQCHNLIKI